MKKKIVLVGAGGHAKSCIDVIELEKKFKIIGLIDNYKKIGTKFLGYSIIGNDSDLEKIRKIANHAIITVGQIKNANLREKLFLKVKKYNFKTPIISSPKSLISNNSKIGEGTIIHHGAIVNAGSEIGCNCIINTNALIEHDCKIGDFSHISTSVTVNGGAIIEKKTFIGSGSVIKNSVKIDKNSIIPMGSKIFKNIKKSK